MLSSGTLNFTARAAGEFECDHLQRRRLAVGRLATRWTFRPAIAPIAAGQSVNIDTNGK